MIAVTIKEDELNVPGYSMIAYAGRRWYNAINIHIPDSLVRLEYNDRCPYCGCSQDGTAYTSARLCDEIPMISYSWLYAKFVCGVMTAYSVGTILSTCGTTDICRCLSSNVEDTI